MSGIALSPEFLMQIQPGTFFPDPERFGVLWMDRDVLAAAYDMVGAFNDVAFTLAPGASLPLRLVIKLAELITRKHSPGRHRVQLLVNGQKFPVGEFQLTAS